MTKIRKQPVSIRHSMSLLHRINVWRIARVCPVCGAERGYSQANPGGLEFNCSDVENCAFTEFVPTGVIHCSGYDAVRFEVLDHNNRVRKGWGYAPSDSQKREMIARKTMYGVKQVCPCGCARGDRE